MAGSRPGLPAPEDIYKIYAESFKDESHLAAIVQEAQEIVTAALRVARFGSSGTDGALMTLAMAG